MVMSRPGAPSGPGGCSLATCVWQRLTPLSPAAAAWGPLSCPGCQLPSHLQAGCSQHWRSTSCPHAVHSAPNLLMAAHDAEGETWLPGVSGVHPVLGSGSPGTPTLHCLQTALLPRARLPSTARCHAHRRPGSLPEVGGSGVRVDPLHLCQPVPCTGGWVLLDTFSAPVLNPAPSHRDRCWLRPGLGEVLCW